MNKVIKKIKALLEKGFATAEEKAAVMALFTALDADEQSTLKTDMEKVEALSEKEVDESEIAKGVREIVNASAKAAVDETRAAVESIKAEVTKWLKEQAEAQEKKAGIYHPEVQDKHKKYSVYLRSFISAALDSDVDTLTKINGNISRKELTTDATGTPYGGYVVDRELSAEIRHLITEYGVARREMTALQLQKHSYLANTLTTDITVYWVDEGASIKSTAPVIGQSTLTLKKLGVIATMTRELLADEEVDLFAFIAGRVAEKFAKAEDQAAFIGDGTSTYGSFTGVLENTNTNVVNMAATKTAFTDLTADDLLAMQDATPTSALANGKYYMHRTILSVVRKLKSTQGEYIYQDPGGSQPATIWNKPVVLVEVMPAASATAVSTPFVLFGDLKTAAIFGYNGAIAADRFNAGVVRNVADNADINLITTDREAIRWIERVGVLTVLPTALTRLVTAAS